MPVINTQPIAPATIDRASIVLSAANANRDGTTGAYASLIVAGANGTIVPEVRVQHAGAAAAASTAMVCRLWHQVGASGTYHLIDEILLASATPNTAAIGGTGVFNRTNIALGAADRLAVTQTVAEAVHYSAPYGDY